MVGIVHARGSAVEAGCRWGAHNPAWLLGATQTVQRQADAATRTKKRRPHSRSAFRVNQWAAEVRSRLKGSPSRTRTIVEFTRKSNGFGNRRCRIRCSWSRKRPNRPRTGPGDRGLGHPAPGDPRGDPGDAQGGWV